MNDFETAVRWVRDGRSTYTEFVISTRERWYAMARWMMRRWKVPAWVDEDDVVQDLLIGAWQGLWEHEEGRGRSLPRHVEYVAVDKAKKRMHKARGAILHGNADGAAGNFEMPFDHVAEAKTEDFVDGISHGMWIAGSIGEEAPQEADMVRRQENEARMVEMCQSIEELLIIQAFAITECLTAGAVMVYGDAEAREWLQLESEEHAEEVLTRAAHAVARRFTQLAA